MYFYIQCIPVGWVPCDNCSCIPTELEETKDQEITKLQEALQAMQVQVDEANAKVIKEREAARKAIEEATPVIKETPVIVQDTEKVEALTAEVEQLKVVKLSYITVLCCG